MFQRTKNIDTAFKHIKGFSIVFLLACCLLSGFVIYKSYEWMARSQERIFILANGKALEAYSADRKDNIPVEAKDHVAMFHHYFFTLDPDEKVIQTNLSKAMYLADVSAKNQYDNLKENGYYSNLISGNISQTIAVDTITINTDIYPFFFRYNGVQTIIRPSAIVTRSLITEGYLRNVSRSDHNSHGFLIEKWKTVDNKDITSQSR
jgi:conjugative transposon TraK protein